MWSGSVKRSPPGSARSRFSGQTLCQSLTPRSAASPDRVSPGCTGTACTAVVDVEVAAGGCGSPNASAGSVSTSPGTISVSGPTVSGLSRTMSLYRSAGLPGRCRSAIRHTVSYRCTGYVGSSRCCGRGCVALGDCKLVATLVETRPGGAAAACVAVTVIAVGPAANSTAIIATNAAGPNRASPDRGGAGCGPWSRIEAATSFTVTAVNTAHAIHTTAAPAMRKYAPVSSLRVKLSTAACTDGRP